jgi:cell division protein FtsB
MDKLNNKDVNIYFNNDKTRDNTLKDSTPYERYIILMNETLQSENRKLSSDIHDLEKKVGELEEENESYDNSKRYTRGLLKNLVEMEKMHSQISTKHKLMFLDTKDYINKYFKKFVYYFRVMECILICLSAVVYNNSVFSDLEFLLFSIFFISPIIFTEMFFNKFNLPVYKNDNEIIKETEEKIKKISDSQDFLSDYIDNL